MPSQYKFYQRESALMVKLLRDEADRLEAAVNTAGTCNDKVGEASAEPARDKPV